MQNPPEIVLRDVVEDDLVIHYAIQREPEGHQMAAVVPRDEAAFFRHWRENILSNGEVKIQTIEWNGEVVGDVTSFIQEGFRLVGYWIGKKRS